MSSVRRPHVQYTMHVSVDEMQGRSQEFDLGGYTLVTGTISNLSWVKETKQSHKKFKVD